MESSLELSDTSLELVNSALELVHELFAERSHCVCVSGDE